MRVSLRTIIVGLAVILVSSWVQPSHADSAIDLVAGFDRQRLQSAIPITDKTTIEEAAKLVYRVGKVNPASFASLASETFRGDETTGEAVLLSGTLIRKKVVAVPKPLADLLGFRALASIELSIISDDSHARGTHVTVIAAGIARDAQPGDRFSVTGMMIGLSSQGLPTIVSAKLTWHPKRSGHRDWQWLSTHGVDLSDLPKLAMRDRRPLLAADGDVFYRMLAAAAKLGISQRDGDAGPAPVAQPVKLLELLSQPGPLVGHYLTLPVQTVQVTRVAVTTPHRRGQLGSDHYFQIDAVADLGNVVVAMEPSSPPHRPADGDGGSPSKSASFEGHYPLSLVMRDLPPFLDAKIRHREGGDAVISDVRVQVQVDGFFFRLWSYETNYMKQFGKDRQFGPLLIAGRLHNRETISADPMGVDLIGWIAAAVTLVAILATWVWHAKTSAEDAAIGKRRRGEVLQSFDPQHSTRSDDQALNDDQC